MKKSKKAKGRGAKRAKETTINMLLTNEQVAVLKSIAEYADRSVEDVVVVLLGVSLFMGQSAGLLPIVEAPAESPAVELAATPPEPEPQT